VLLGKLFIGIHENEFLQNVLRSTPIKTKAFHLAMFYNNKVKRLMKDTHLFKTLTLALLNIIPEERAVISTIKESKGHLEWEIFGS